MDYGARYYDASIGRFLTIDRYAEKYFTLTPYQYGANNPILNIDVNGDSVWFTNQYDKSGKLIGVTMHVQGVVINVSNEDVDMDYAVKTISEHLAEYYQGEFDGISFNTEVDLRAVESMEDVKESDHVFALANIEPMETMNEYGEIEKRTVTGASNQRYGKVAFIDAGYFTGIWDKNIGNIGEATAGHEFGHLLGLEHTKNYFNIMSGINNNWITPATNVSSSQLRQIYKSRYFLNQGSNYEYVPSYRGLKKMPNRGKVYKLIKY